VTDQPTETLPIIRFTGDNHCIADMWTVAVYEKTRHYGGPEEGDWHWDQRELVAVVPVPEGEDAASDLALKLEKGEFADRGRPLHSVNFGMGDDKVYAMYIIAPGDEIVYLTPTEAPRYS
jgi:hypothetical protein